MDVYKIEVIVIDHDELGPEEIKKAIEDTKYPNWCISPIVLSTTCKTIDDEELDSNSITVEKSNELFNKK